MSKTKTLIDAEAWLEQCNKSYMHYNLAKKIIAEAPRVEVPDGVADFLGYRSHFESCPHANQFRKRGKADV